MSDYPIPPWVGNADIPGVAATGMRLQMEREAQRAAALYRQKEMARQQTQDAVQKAQFDAEYGLRASQAGAKLNAMNQYQQAVSGGMDPIQAMLQFGPAMGSGAGEAAAIRGLTSKPPTWSELTTPSGANFMQSSKGQLVAERPPAATWTDATMQGAGGQSVLGQRNSQTGLFRALAQNAQEGAVTPRVRLAVTQLQRRERMIEQSLAKDEQMYESMSAMPEKSRKPATQQFIAAYEKRKADLKTLQDQIDQLTAGEGAPAAAPAAGGLKILSIRPAP